MNTSNSEPEEERRPREDAWATPVSRLKVRDLPAGAVNLNVEGRQVVGPLQGFGQLWQKTYQVRLTGSPIKPAEVISVWKQEFPNFWPEGNYFYGPLTGIRAGEVAVLNLAGPGRLSIGRNAPMISTGVMVIYADEETFSFMTPEGHMFAAMITFSAYEDDGTTTAQIQALIRASDPLYELGLRLGVIHKAEDEFWHQTLKNLAARFGVDGYVQQNVAVLDPKLQWSYAKNIWHNAAIRTAIYLLLTPFRWLRVKLFR